MDIYTLLSALAIIFLPGLGCYVYSKNTKDPLYLVFVLFCVLAGYLAFCELQIHLASSPEVAAFWSKLRFIRFFLISLFLHVIILYTSLKSPLLNRKLIYIVLYLPALLFACYDFCANEHLRQLALTPQGYAILQLPPFTPFYVLYEIWVLSLGLTACGFSFVHYRKDPTFRTLFNYVLLATLAPMCGRLLEILTFLVWPNRLPTLYPLFAVWIIFFLFLGMHRHKFPRLTPYEIINTVIDTMAEAYLLLDTKGRILNLNKAAERITEWSMYEACGNDIDLIFKVINKGTKEDGINLIEQLLLQGSLNSSTHDLLLITKTGKEIPIDHKFAPLHDEQRHLWGAILIFRDLSEIVGSKQELKATQDQLIHSEKLAGLGRLAAGVAHEINNPLGYITSNLRTLTKYVAALKEAYKQYQQLLAKIGPLPSEIQREFDKKLVLDFIIEDIDEIVKENKEGIDKIVQIVSDLKSFTHSNPEEVFKPADINKAIKNTITVTRNEFKYVADVKCELAELPEIQCNLSEINQVLLNVIVNAAQAIKSQKRAGKGLIQINTCDEQDHIRCEITDDGPGILPENLTRIFEPFFTTKPPGEGTGLGLSISYDIIINKHRGAFLVESTVGQGTKFIIRLPKKQN